MAKVVEINDSAELDHFYLIWNLLHKQTPRGSFFQSIDWLKTYWQHFGVGQKMRVLVVYENGDPIGIVPLVVRRETTHVGRIRVLTYPLHDWAMFYGPIGSQPAETMNAALQYIHDARRDWDMLDLRCVDNSVDNGCTPAAMKSVGLHFRRSVWKETAVVNTSGSWDDFFARKTSKFRNNVRRCERKLAELGEVTFERFRPLGTAKHDDDPRWDLYDECVDLARRSWQGSSTDGTTLSHNSVADFFRETHELAAKAGAVDVGLLRLDGRLVGFGYNYHQHGYIDGLRVGCDPDYTRPGVGTVLFLNLFRDSFERHDRAFDLGPGSVHAKRSWLTDIVPCYRYTHFSLLSPRTQLLRLKHWMNDRANAKEFESKRLPT